MKKIFKLIIILTVVISAGCTTLFKKEKPEVFTTEQMQNWDKTLIKNLTENALMPEYYGEEDPITYLQKTGKMNEKEFMFLQSLQKTKTEKGRVITDEESEKFSSIVKKYNKKLKRKFYLNDENIKDGVALTKKMVSESYLRMETPSSHISKEVATKKEWEKIVSFSKKSDLTEKDITSLRKILNKFIKRNEIFKETAWYSREVSPRVLNIIEISKKESKNSIEKNNINAKALYTGYSQYLSKMDRWDS